MTNENAFCDEVFIEIVMIDYMTNYFTKLSSKAVKK